MIAYWLFVYRELYVIHILLYLCHGPERVNTAQVVFTGVAVQTGRALYTPAYVRKRFFPIRLCPWEGVTEQNTFQICFFLI